MYLELVQPDTGVPLRFDPGRTPGEYALTSLEIRRVVGFDHRAYVGPFDYFDVLSAAQFSLLTTLGLREYHTLLDIGCGSLRAGRLFLMYLLPGRYFGVEPNAWLVDEGFQREIGEDLRRLKRPRFSARDDFDFSEFNQTFDYLLAQSIFSHAALRQIGRALASARQVMTDTSLFVATYYQGEKDYNGETWVYPQIVPYRRSTIEAAAARAGLACRHLDWPHPVQTWVVFGSDTALDGAKIDHLAQCR